MSTEHELARLMTGLPEDEEAPPGYSASASETETELATNRHNMRTGVSKVTSDMAHEESTPKILISFAVDESLAQVSSRRYILYDQDYEEVAAQVTRDLRRNAILLYLCLPNGDRCTADNWTQWNRKEVEHLFAITTWNAWGPPCDCIPCCAQS